MNPQDDPEARIRDLERPLSEAAQTSELGTAPYTVGAGPVPPTQPWSYDPMTPNYAPQQPHTAGGTRIRGGTIALFTAIGVALAGGVAMYLAFASSSPDTQNNPGFSGGGGAIATSPSPRSGSERPSTEPRATPTPPATSAAPPGELVSVAGVRGNKTLTCTDNAANVSGVSNIVVITGHCVSLIVSGVDNVVTVDSVDSINASGFGNQVTFLSGSPQISRSGPTNTVERG